MQWDLFCHVVDNHGDLGFCWRLAADLAQRGEQVRLWVDDARALAWMAPRGAAGVQVHRWCAQPGKAADADAVWPEPGNVVIEAYGCTLPPGFVRLMAAAHRPPVWINLEYLSAEPYVERSHGLPSPQSNGPGRGLRKWFYYPGYTAATGGLLREESAAQAPAPADLQGLLQRLQIASRPGERIVSLFCYPQPLLAQLAQRLADGPTLLLTTPGAATEYFARQRSDTPGTLRVQPLPWLEQPDYDHLLGLCSLNFVRGEDSLVRAMWAGRPFIWQAYVQPDAAHLDKVDALLNLIAPHGDPQTFEALAAWMRAWNGAPGAALSPALPATEPWQQLCTSWRNQLLQQPSLTDRLLRFIADKG